MLEFEFNSPLDTAVLVEFFSRCGWSESEAGPKLEWALAASDQWVVCRLDGEMVGFGRSCRLGPLKRVVFDVLVDARFRGRGLRSEIVRLLVQSAGDLEEVSLYSDRDTFACEAAEPEEGLQTGKPPWAGRDTYLGKRSDSSGRR